MEATLRKASNYLLLRRQLTDSAEGLVVKTYCGIQLVFWPTHNIMYNIDMF